MVLVYAVKDRKLNEFLFPIAFKNDGVAVRFFGEFLKGDRIRGHVQDYSIWLIGEWNPETGLLIPVAIRDITPYSEMEVSNG